MTTPPASLPPYHEKGLDLDIDNSDLESTYSDAASTPSTSTALFTDASTIPSPPSPILAPLPFLQQPSPPLTRDATPWPDSTYILLHVATRRPLTLLQGKGESYLTYHILSSYATPLPTYLHMFCCRYILPLILVVPLRT